MITLEKTETTYEQAIAWWDKKTDEQKFRAVGIEVIDKWVRDIISSEFEKSSVIKPL
jgi:hypothetical protein